MYNKNKIGPRIVPCGTPHCRNLSDDLLQFTIYYLAKQVTQEGNITTQVPFMCSLE